MAEPMRVRAQYSKGRTTVRVLMSHEMESGQRLDSSGKVIPAWYIEEVQVYLNESLILTSDWSGGISKNPYMQFFLKTAQVGDKIKIVWKDSKGDTRTDQAAVIQEN